MRDAQSDGSRVRVSENGVGIQLLLFWPRFDSSFVSLSVLVMFVLSSFNNEVSIKLIE